ncbi:MAG: glycerophosphoryl diester phosphodiesterase [Gammaproteobacteria bacterium]|nr:glycerophosphoryl diester phosphodiesterase [Gammaproteobacteria bacterium]MBP9729231.1 glycerophosphoryl diester phosphodiesterase [Gammaproteobacteria bacterium]
MQQKTFQQLPKPHLGLIGHRGAAGLAPENTLEGFQVASAHGIHWVEFDVQYCASGEWILFHDADLPRTTNGKGLIFESTWAQLKGLDAGSWFAPTYKNAQIPLLEEALRTLLRLNVYPVIEIKIFESPQKQAIADLLHRVQSVWPPTAPPPLFSSFDLQSLLLLRACDPTLLIGYLVSDLNTEAIALATQKSFSSLHCQDASITPALIAEAHLQKLPLLAYTVNDPLQIQSLLQQGVFAVFSDLTFLKDEKHIENSV